jgi:8-oxo-dGTP pyrophosphatase MutT (NUDIX family)
MTTLQPDELQQRLRTVLAQRERSVVHLTGFDRAGVLVPIVCVHGTYELLFTRRTEIVETHKGQVSFPGGMADATDRDIIQTALREAWEEIGIPESSVEVLGLGDDLPTPTGFIITPIVGLINNLPPLTINTGEVAQVFQVPLTFFTDPGNGKRELREIRGERREVWYYEYGGHVIWGATAMIVRSLLRTVGMV